MVLQNLPLAPPSAFLIEKSCLVRIVTHVHITQALQPDGVGININNNLSTGLLLNLKRWFAVRLSPVPLQTIISLSEDIKMLLTFTDLIFH